MKSVAEASGAAIDMTTVGVGRLRKRGATGYLNYSAPLAGVRSASAKKGGHLPGGAGGRGEEEVGEVGGREFGRKPIAGRSGGSTGSGETAVGDRSAPPNFRRSGLREGKASRVPQGGRSAVDSAQAQERERL